MRHFNKWPLAVAVSSALVLAGCFGGSGGSSSSRSSNEGPAAPEPSTSFTYVVSVDVPDSNTVAALPPQGRLELVLSGVINSLIGQALAELVDSVQPGDFSLKRYSAEGDDEELEISVEQDGTTYEISSEHGPATDTYLEVSLGNVPGVSPGVSLRVPANGESLVMDPVTTLVTQQIASRLAELDQLTLDEIDEVIEQVRAIAEDPEVAAAIEAAIYSASSTDDLLDLVGQQLSAAVEELLDNATAPPASASATAASGKFNVHGLSLGLYGDEKFGGGGYLTGDFTGSPTLTFGSDTVEFQVAAESELTTEFVHQMGANAEVLFRGWTDDEPDSGTLSLDGRGIFMPEFEEFGPYDQDDMPDGPDFYCVTQSNDCTDREFEAASRLLAAGPAASPLSTLIGASFSTREVLDGDNSVVVKVLNAGLEVLIREAASQPALTGRYGMIELAVDSENTVGSAFLDVGTYLLEAEFDGAGNVSFCEPLARYTFSNLAAGGTSITTETEDECATADYILASNGALILDSEDEIPSEGWLAEDGLTFVTGSRHPDMAAVLTAGGWLEQSWGNSQFLLGLKLADSNALAGKRYRLIAVGLNADAGELGMHRVQSGSLSFDEQGQPSLSASLLTQVVTPAGLGGGSAHVPVNPGGLSMTLDSGAVSLSGTLGDDEFSASGFVRADSRVIVLNHLISGTDLALNGLMIAVCTNCED